MSVTLPLRTDLNNYSFKVELDGVTYGIRIWFNDRDPGWVFDLLDVTGARIASGIKLVVDWPLAKRFRDVRLPPGVLIATDTTGNHQDPTAPKVTSSNTIKSDLGDRVQLLYFAASET